MKRPALLMLVLLAGCAPRPTPPPTPADEYAELVRLSVEVPNATRIGDPIASIGGTACQTSDRMPNAVSGSIPSTALIPRSESVGTPVPMPNACPVTAGAGMNARVVEYQRDGATVAPEPPR